MATRKDRPQARSGQPRPTSIADLERELRDGQAPLAKLASSLSHGLKLDEANLDPDAMTLEVAGALNAWADEWLARNEGADPLADPSFWRSAALAMLGDAESAAAWVRKWVPNIPAALLSHVLTGDDLRSWSPPDVRYLIEGLIPVGGTSLIVADPFGGKSTWARTVAADLTRDGTKVYYLAIDERSQPHSVLEHLHKLRPEWDNLYMDFEPVKTVEDGLARIDAALSTWAPGLVIVDTLARLFGPVDFDKYGDTVRAWDPLIDRANDAHIMGLHHANKLRTGGVLSVMGSQGLAASADVLLSIATDDDETRWMTAIGRGSIRLPRTRLDFDEATGRADLGTTEATEKRKAEQATSASKVYDYLAAQELGRTSREIQRATGVPKRTCNRTLEQLQRDGCVTASGERPPRFFMSLN